MLPSSGTYYVKREYFRKAEFFVETWNFDLIIEKLDFSILKNFVFLTERSIFKTKIQVFRSKYQFSQSKYQVFRLKYEVIRSKNQVFLWKYQAFQKYVINGFRMLGYNFRYFLFRYKKDERSFWCSFQNFCFVKKNDMAVCVVSKFSILLQKNDWPFECNCEISYFNVN